VAAQAALFGQVEKPHSCNAVQAQTERMGRDASDAAHLQQQVQQQLQAKGRLLGEMTDANKQLQVCLTFLACARTCSASSMSISLFCIWHLMHCHLGSEADKPGLWLQSIVGNAAWSCSSPCVPG